MNLSKNRLDEKSFPQVLSRLQMLEELNLSGNNLTEFPSFILDLPRLKVLHLAENQIQSVPADIGRLNQLERLYLGKNCLRDIPRQVNIYLLKLIFYMIEKKIETIFFSDRIYHWFTSSIIGKQSFTVSSG